MVFVGIDIGTTSLKAAAFDEHGKRLSLAVRSYVLDTDSSTGYIEFDPEEYIRLTLDAIREIRQTCPEITALSVDTQGETMIFADADGKPLYPAINWLDNRADAEADDIKRHFGNRRVYEVTGQPEITAGWPACKLLWFKRNRPELFSRTKKVFLLEDWILYRLSGVAVTEPTIQSSSIWFDITKGGWWTDMLDYLGVTADILPRLVRSGEKVGEFEGAAVVAGALDQLAGTIGAGVTDGSRVSEMTGTIMAICAMTDKIPPYRPDSIIPCHIHTVSGKYCLILWSSTAGMALKWFREQLAEGCSFRELDGLAEKVAPGCDGLTMLPYFCGSTMPEYNPDARACFAGLDLSHTRGHMARAIMEAVAFTLRRDLEYIGDSGIDEIRITGGGASSPLWSQIKADVTGRTLYTVDESETACLGTAMLAAVGFGAFPSIEAAAKSAVRTKRKYSPSSADYTEAYNRYCRLSELILNAKLK